MATPSWHGPAGIHIRASGSAARPFFGELASVSAGTAAMAGAGTIGVPTGAITLSFTTTIATTRTAVPSTTVTPTTRMAGTPTRRAHTTTIATTKPLTAMQAIRPERQDRPTATRVPPPAHLTTSSIVREQKTSPSIITSRQRAAILNPTNIVLRGQTPGAGTAMADKPAAIRHVEVAAGVVIAAAADLAAAALEAADGADRQLS